MKPVIVRRFISADCAAFMDRPRLLFGRHVSGHDEPPSALFAIFAAKLFPAVRTDELRRDFRHDCIAVAPQQPHSAGYPMSQRE